MKKFIVPVVLTLLAAMTFSCSDRNAGAALDEVSSYISDNPEKALQVLDSLKGTHIKGRSDKARFALLYSMALDKNYIDITSDSIINVAVKWYDRHGNADERLKAYYYQGVIHENKGDLESAMESFVKAEVEVPEAEDNVAIGMLYRAMSYIYAVIFNLDEATQCIELAKSYYKTAGDSSKYASALNFSTTIYYASGEIDKAQSCLDSVRFFWNDIDNTKKNEYYTLSMSMKKESNDRTGLERMLDEYLSEFDPADISWLEVAEFFIFLGHFDDAKNALHQYSDLYPDYKNEPAYYLLTYELYKSAHEYKSAFENLEIYSDVMDSLNFELAQLDTRFLEERYEKELLIERERNTRTMVIMISAFGIVILSAAVGLLLRRLRDRNAEATRYRDNLAGLKRERDELAATIAGNPPVGKQAMAVLNDRLKLLNDIFAAEISPRGRNPYREVEKLISRREEFLYTTRMTFAAAHPDFIAFLEGKGLTEEEVEYCCLYAIGLKGTEISSFFGNNEHYKGSSAIRSMLGLGPHDTNLGIFLRSKL